MKACDSLLTSVYFAPDELRACCKRYHVDGHIKGDAVLLANVSQSQIDISQIIQKKNELIQQINSPSFDNAHQCYGCPWIQDYNVQDLKPEVSFVSIEMSSVCNMRCTYCSETYYGGKVSNYNIHDFMDTLIASNDELSIVFGGGEPVINPDFESLLIKSTHNNSCSNVKVFTNSTIFSTALSKALDDGSVSITTSIDAGSRDTFKVVRGLDAFQKVFVNLQKYAQANPNLVTIKYIFCDHNNDLPNVTGFVDLVSEYGLQGCNFQISSDFKNDQLLDHDIGLILKMKSHLDMIAPGRVFIDDHLAPRLIAHSGSALTRSGKYIVWGTGEHSRRIFERLGTSNIEFFVNSYTLGGELFMGKPVFAKDALCTSDLPVYIASVQAYSEIYSTIAEMGFQVG